MLFQLKKFYFMIFFNFTLFFILMIGIQNSSTRKQLNLIIKETIELPISFVVGISFISGSLTGSILQINFENNKK